jgi:plastocyanin
VAAVLAFGGLVASGSASAASTTTVSITSRLEPASVTVTVGDTVVWRNDDGSRHRIESTSGPAEFESDNLDPGATFAVNFAVAGTYRYRDHRNDDNPAYWGTVTVVAPGGGTTGPGGGTSPPAGTPAPPSSARVGMADRTFSPGSVTIAAGGSVQWTNDDDDSHTASGSAFDSGILSPGRTFNHTFPAAGSFSYLCQIHPDMRGTVSVVASGESPPGTNPPPSSSPPSSSPPPSGGTAAPAPPPPAPGATAREVAMIDLDFSPRAVSAAAGDTITWVNRGSAIHTATADGAAFDSGIVSPGGRFTFRAATPGTFAYRCTVHPGMRGTVTVVGRAGPSPAVVAPATTSAVGAPAPPAGATPAPPVAAPAGDSGPATAAVAIVDLEFSPARVRVATGGEVTWTNDGAAPHTATARDQSFDSGILAPQGTFSRRFDAPGTYDYICLVHPNMLGVVEVGATVAGVVQDAGAAPTGTVETGSDEATDDGTAAGAPATAELSATGRAASSGGDGQMVWVPVFAVALMLAALAWAGFGPPIGPREQGAS